jgi:hypothetical protein
MITLVGRLDKKSVNPYIANTCDPFVSMKDNISSYKMIKVTFSVTRVHLAYIGLVLQVLMRPSTTVSTKPANQLWKGS